MSKGALSLTALECAQASIERAVALLEELEMDPGEHGVYFGQLLGMADPLTYVLGRNGYRVSVQGPLLSIRYDIRAGRSARTPARLVFVWQEQRQIRVWLCCRS